MNAIQWHGSAVRGFAVRGDMGTFFFARRSRPFARVLALLGVVALVASTQIVPRPPAEAAVAVADVDGTEDVAEPEPVEAEAVEADLATSGDVPAPEQVTLAIADEWDVPAMAAAAAAPISHPGPEPHGPEGPGDEVLGVVTEPAAPTTEEPAELHLSMVTSASSVTADSVFGATFTITNHGPGDAEDVGITYAFGDDLLVVRSVHCDNDPFGTDGCDLGTIKAGETVEAAVLLWSRAGALGAQPLGVSVSTGGTPATLRTPGSGEDEVLSASSDDDPDSGGDELDVPAGRDTVVILTPAPTVGVTAFPTGGPVAQDEPAELSVVAVADTDTVPAGSTVTYTVFVTNSGPGRSVDTTVTIGALPGLTLTATDGCLEDPSGFPVCSIGSLAASSTKIVTFTFVAGPNPQGAVDFTVQVDSTTTDPISLNDESTVQLEFNGPPVANNDTAVIAEDAAATALDLAGNDADPDGDSLTVTAIDSSATIGTVTLAAGVVSYDPAGAFDALAAGATATDTFDYTVEDGIAGSSTGTVVVTITGVNEAPVVVDDAIATTEDVAVTVTKADLLADDTDANSDTLTFGTVSTAGTTGDVTTTATQVTYDPDGAFEALGVGESDTDTFTYSISDGNGGTDNGAVTVTVNGVNDAPNAVNDTIAVGEDDVAAALTLLTNDTDPDTNDTLTITAINVTGTFGEATLTSGVVSYDPDGDFEFLAAGDGSDTTFTYTVSDGNGGTDIATVTLKVTGTNDAPTAVNDVAMAEAGGAAIDIDVDANDTDPDAFDVPMLESISALGIDGSVSIVAGKIRYTPPAAPTTDTFSYTIKDGQGATATGTVTVTVAFGPLPPTAVDDTASIDADAASMTLNVLGNDTDPNLDTLRIASINSTTTTGSVSLSPAGVVSFDPNGAFDSLPAGQTATTTFTYVVTDDDATTANDTGTVTITVSGVNDAPTGVGDTFSLTEDDAATTLNVTDNDTDPDVGDTVTVTAVTPPARGSATLTSGVVRYDPAGDFEFLGLGDSALETFDYTVTDANGATGTATVTVTITGVNDAPIAPDAAVTFSEDGPGATVSVTPTDPENGVVVIDAVGGTPTGSVTLVGGLITYDPNGAFEALSAGESAIDMFTYTVSDDQGSSASGTITVTIDGVNDAIAANADTFDVDENVGAAVTLDVLANDTDVDGLDTKTITGIVGNEGTVTIDNGTLTYLPNYAAAQSLPAGATVIDEFAYTVTDGKLQDTATVRVTVNGQNDPPTTVADSLTIDEDDTANINVISNDTGGEATDTVELDSVAAPLTGAAAKLSASNVEYTASGWDHLDDGETSNEDVTYTAIDGSGVTSTGTLTVTVNGVNDAPVAMVDAASAVTAGPAIPIMVLDNDSDPDASDTLEITGVAALPLPATPTQGTVVFTPTSVTYTPHPTFIGTDVFTYTISDGDQTATAIVSVTVTPEADLSITVADDADPIVAGGDVTYTVTVTNNGPSPATNVTGGFVTPTDTTLIGSSPTALGTIANGTSAVFTVSLRTDESPNSSTVTFMPSVLSGVTDPNATNNAGSEDTLVTPTPNADVKVTASVDKALVVPGDTATWTVTVENLGPDDATAVAATSTLPAGVTLVSTTGCTEDPAGVATCSLGTIAAGASASFDIAATVDVGTTGTLQLSTSASSPVVDFTPGNDSATSSTVSPVPPTAVDDAPPAASTPGMVFHTPVNTTLMTIDGSTQDLDTNDTVGDPVSTITSFGGGSLGGAVTDHLAGSTATINGVGSITVNGDGTLTFVPVITATGMTSFNYRRTNVGGTSDAAVTIAIGAQPNAVADSYASIGNVGISVPAANGVLTNDAGDSLSISASDTVSALGGSVAVAADGGFTYNPAPGTTGADTFTYTIANGFGTSTATVTINLSGMIWFVDGTAAAGGDGTFDGPFNAMPASVGGNGDTIFVKTNVSGAIALQPQQKLIGAGTTKALAAEAGVVTVPAFSFALPTIGGARPTVTGTAATATVGLSSDNTVRGLELAATGVGGAAIGETTPGNDPGTTTILDASASATGGSAIQVSGGTQNITLDRVSAAGSSDGVQLTGSVAGAIELSGMTVDVASAAALKIEGFATVTVTGTSTAAVRNPVTAAVEVAAPIGPNGVTFEFIDSSGGPTAIKLTGTGSGAFNVTGVGNADASGGTIQKTTDDAIILSNVAGPVTLKNMTFTDIGNPGIAGISGHDVVHVQDLTGKLTIDNADVSIVSDNFVHGVAGSVFSGGLEVTNSTIDRTNRFDSTSTSGDGTNQSEGAIWADGISGTVTITSNAFTNGNQFVYLKPSTSAAMTAAIDRNSFEIPDNGALSTTGFYCINIDGAGGMHTVNIGVGGANTFTNCFLRSIRMHASAGTIGGSITNNTMTVTDHDDGAYGNTTNWSQGGVWLYTTGSGALAPLNVTSNAFGATGDRWLSSIANLEIQPDGAGSSTINVMSNTFTAAFESVWQVRGSGTATVTIQNNTYLTETLNGQLLNEFGVTWEGPGRPYCVAARSGANLTVTINNETLQGHELDAAQAAYAGASLQLVEQAGGSLTANVSGVQINPSTVGNNDDISVYAGVGGTQTGTGATAIVQEQSGALSSCGVIAQ